MAIFEKYTAVSNRSHYKSAIMSHVLDLLGVTELTEIKSIEKNGEIIWITLEDGSIKSLAVVECEPYDMEYPKIVPKELP